MFAWRIAPDGLDVMIRLTPKSAKNDITGVDMLADGRVAIIARVTPPPEDGKANAELIKLLAKNWGLPKSRMNIAAGLSARIKRVHITGDGEALAQQLETWFNSGNSAKFS